MPELQRNVGDAFVKEEFRKHQGADTKFVVKFMDEWSSYLVTLQQQQGNFGVDLSRDQVSEMNEEQVEQLQQLHRAANKKE